MKFMDHTLEIGKRTYVMGILNATPDSFSDGGQFNEVKAGIEHAIEMVEEGADIIDVGGESTRPGAKEVTLEDELERVVPLIKGIRENVNVPISIDTYKAKVAEAALQAGANMVNDVWGLQREPEIAKVAARAGAPVIAMHNQKGTHYDEDIIESMRKFFKKSIQIALDAGVPKEHIILDPGIGFGKTSEQNVVVMGRLHELHDLGYPILLGTSRKSMIGKILDLPSDERVEGTIATNVVGVMAGMEIVRVHDVKENLRAVKVADAIVRGWNG
ncbi:dihydropteroate synthase [Fusibacter sp. JL216-2]|uniref:dihydropteroate synthase n=1 Tax=Fusibacter sp. JL216-2 TaxID=3071453 RepID=UPI003D32A72A